MSELSDTFYNTTSERKICEKKICEKKCGSCDAIKDPQSLYWSCISFGNKID